MAKRRLLLEDKLVATTLLFVGIVMLIMTITLLGVIGTHVNVETDMSVRPMLTLGVLLVMVATYGAIMVILWLLVRWMIVRPTRRLLTATREVAAGRLDYRAEPMSTDELGELAESFSRMTERLQDSFESIEHLSEFNALVLDSMSSGLIAVDGLGYIRTANRTACDILGVPNEELSGAMLSEVETVGPLAEVVEQARRDRHPVGRIEVAVRPEPDRSAILGVSVSPLGEDGGAVAVFADLTLSRELERQARIRREMASLGELTAGVVHEIRSPLGVISATAQLLMRNLQPDEKAKDTAGIILDEVAQLEKTVTDLLVFAKPLELDLKQVPLADIVERAVTLCRPRVDETSIELRMNGTDTPVQVRADRERLAQAIANLLRNSIDALGDDGTIHIETAVIDDDTVAVLIKDNGPGIPEEFHERLFEPFFTQKEDGTGLGLSIVHKVIAAHQGQIDLIPTNNGTTFQITVPRSQ